MPQQYQSKLYCLYKIIIQCVLGNPKYYSYLEILLKNWPIWPINMKLKSGKRILKALNGKQIVGVGNKYVEQ